MMTAVEILDAAALETEILDTAAQMTAAATMMMIEDFGQM
jgi:hypothetical protein